VVFHIWKTNRHNFGVFLKHYFILVLHYFTLPMTFCHFWDLHCLKIIYFAQCPLYHVSQWPLVSKKIKIQSIFNLNAHNVPYVIFLFFDIVSNVLNLQCLNAPYYPKRKFSCPTQSPLCFQCSTHMLLLITILSFLINIFIFLSSPIFRHPWCCI